MDVTKRGPGGPRIGVLPELQLVRSHHGARNSAYYAVFGCRADIDALMDLTQLRDKSGALFNTLSGGLKQRLGIAAALVNDRSRVLDEPTTGASCRRAVWDVLRPRGNAGKPFSRRTSGGRLWRTVASSRRAGSATDSPRSRRSTPIMRLTLGSRDASPGLIRKMGFDPADERQASASGQ
jgi:hypothetical protein